MIGPVTSVAGTVVDITGAADVVIEGALALLSVESAASQAAATSSRNATPTSRTPDLTLTLTIGGLKGFQMSALSMTPEF
jgi:hypothetical protein